MLTVTTNLLDHLGCNCCPPIPWVRAFIDTTIIAWTNCSANHSQGYHLDSGLRYRTVTRDWATAPIDCSGQPGTVRRMTETFPVLSATADATFFCGPSASPSFSLPVTLDDLPPPDTAAGSCTTFGLPSEQAGGVSGTHSTALGPPLSRTLNAVHNIVGRVQLATAPPGARFWRVIWTRFHRPLSTAPWTHTPLIMEGLISPDDVTLGHIDFPAPDLITPPPGSNPGTASVQYAATPLVFVGLGIPLAQRPGFDDPSYPRVEFAL